MSDVAAVVTFFTDRFATTKIQRSLTIDELETLARNATAPSKGQLQWLKLAIYGEQRSAKGSLRHNSNLRAICGTECDYDGQIMQPTTARDLLAAAGIECIVCTSPSHTPEKPRWRVWAFTYESLPPERRWGLTAAINGVLGGVLATESFTLSQGFYLGSVASNPHHEVYRVAGMPIDLAVQLGDLPEVGPPRPEPLAMPQVLPGLPPDAHTSAAIGAVKAAFIDAEQKPGGRHAAILPATWLLAPLVKSGHISEADAAAAVSEAMFASGREPNDDEVQHALRRAVERAEPYKPWPDGSEFNDYVAPAQPVTTPLRLIHPADCETGPRRGYVIKSLLAPGDVAALIGPPSTGKSMCAPYLGYGMAQGRNVFGCRTKPGRVLYVAGEDATGMRQRIHALKLQHGDAPDFALAECGNLNEPINRRKLLDTVDIWRPALVVLATVGALFAGMDENASKDMGDVVDLARRLAATGAAVLLIHHTAKQGDGTPRGHSVLNGTLDMVLRLEPKDDAGIIRGFLGKNRNGTTDRDIAFRYHVVPLGEDEDGDQITAPMAAELSPNNDRSERLVRLSPTEQRAFDILRTMGDDVLESDWRAACVDQAISTSDEPRNRVKVVTKVIKSLLDKRRVVVSDGVVRLVSGTNVEPTDFRQEPSGTSEEPQQADSGGTRNHWNHTLKGGSSSGSSSDPCSVDDLDALLGSGPNVTPFRKRPPA